MSLPGGLAFIQQLATDFLPHYVAYSTPRTQATDTLFEVRNGLTQATARLTVGTNGTNVTGTLGVSGATTLSSTLAVSGATTLSSTLAVSGATTLSSTLGVSGATTLSSTLAVSGTSTLTGRVSAPAGVTIDSTSSSALFVVNGAITSLRVASGAVGIGGDHDVSYALKVTGAQWVTGAATFSSTLSVTGTITGNSTSDNVLRGNLQLRGADVTTDGGVQNSKDLIFVGNYDSDATAAVASATIAMRMRATVTSGSNYKLSLLNNAATEVFGVDQAGNSSIAGRLTVADVLTTNAKAQIQSGARFPDTADGASANPSVQIGEDTLGFKRTAAGTLTLTGALNIATALGVTGATTLSNTLTVGGTITGQSTAGAEVYALSVAGDTVIEGGNGTIHTITPGFFKGLVVAHNTNVNGVAMFLVDTSNNLCTLVSKTGTINWTTTKDSATSYNVYVEANVLKIQNTGGGYMANRWLLLRGA